MADSVIVLPYYNVNSWKREQPDHKCVLLVYENSKQESDVYLDGC